MYSDKTILAIVGPTATGKTKLAIRLAKEIQGEIVSADSMQIYKEMNIVTAKPSKEEMQNIVHHMIDIVDLGEKFSVAQYKTKAYSIIDSIFKRNKLPIIVGGTGLYVNALVDNINFLENSKNEEINLNLWRRMEQEGPEILMEELSKIDPNTAQKLHLNDKKRIIRALEIYKTTGYTLSQQNIRSRLQGPIYRVKIIGLDYLDREKLYNAINERVDSMIEKGLLEELRSILSRHKTEDISDTAAGMIGYKELLAYFRGDCTLNTAIEQIKQNTRRYSKRQRTWFKRDKRIHWIYIDNYPDMDKIYQDIIYAIKGDTHLNEV